MSSTQKIILRDLHIQMDAAAGGLPVLIDIKGATDISFIDCKIEHTGGNSVKAVIGGSAAVDVTRMQIRNCEVIMIAGSDFCLSYLEDWVDVKLLNSSFDRSLIEDNTTHTKTRVIECKVLNGGISISAGEECAIVDCITGAIISMGANKSRVRGNYVNGAGIEVWSNNCVITGNIIDVAVVDTGANNTVANNTVY